MEDNNNNSHSTGGFLEPIEEEKAGSSSEKGGGHSSGVGHPVAVFFHIAFKVAALVCYEALEKLTGSFVITFIVVVVLSAADFWTTKNVTGRLLVGLRWWNEVKEDGSDHWIFESLEDRSRIITREVWIFWGALIIGPIIWFFLAFGAIFSILSFSPQWLVVCVIVQILYGANAIGFFKCARDSKSKLKKYATNTATSYFTSAIMSAVMTNKDESKV